MPRHDGERRDHRATSRPVRRQAQARELPALVWIEEIAVARADVAVGCRARTAPKHELGAHEFAVVFAHCTRRGPKSRIGAVGARRPFPHITIKLLQWASI